MMTDVLYYEGRARIPQFGIVVPALARAAALRVPNRVRHALRIAVSSRKMVRSMQQRIDAGHV
jgi:hypothetical protein